jgi:hypothetical protein
MHGSRPSTAPSRNSIAFARSGVIARILREPLVHFIVLGALIFVAAHIMQARSERYVIKLGPIELRRIAATYAQQYGAPPSEAEMKAMTDDYVRQEILLREGQAIGLDKDDEIVRRRVAQKYEFLLQDRTVSREPAESDLEDWFAKHRAQYVIPPRRSFDHLYYAMDTRGENAARQLAQVALSTLKVGRPAPDADPFPGTPVIRLLSQLDTDRLFGGDVFASQVFAAPLGQWSGPYRSAFGWHVIRVSEDQKARSRELPEVRAQVLADWRTADRAARNKAAYADISDRYRIVREDPGQ